MEVTIAIDDLHPEKGWGMKGDKCMEYLEQLNKEFGAKFTLFIPSNYHDKYPISEHQEWIDWLKSKDYFELAAHGHYHMCLESDFLGECEFAEIMTDEVAEDRIQKMMNEWNAVGHVPCGWRSPGWLAHPEAVKWLGPQFKYAAVHYDHNQIVLDEKVYNIKWDCKLFFGHDGIHETDLHLHDGRIMFQSHIAGNHNDNIWNQKNYEQLDASLTYLLKSYKLEFKTFNEL